MPPRDDTLISHNPGPERNKSLDIMAKQGKKAWYKIRKYGKQNDAELAIQRYKPIIGNKLHSRELSRQKNEVIIATSLLNKFAAIGMLLSYRTG